MATQRQIAAALRDAVFAPGKPGPMKVIADVGNFDYYIRRAQELLINVHCAPTADQRDHYLQHVLSVLALAKVENAETKDQTETRPGSKDSN